MEKLLIGILLLSTAALQSQTIQPTYIFYSQHLNLVNPAAVGNEKSHTISANIRSQWSGTDAPVTQSFFTTHRINNSVGVGLSVVADRVFVQRQTAIFADFAYRIPITETSNIVGGIKFGGDFFNVDIDKIVTYNHLYNMGHSNVQFDPYLQHISGKFQFNFGAGVFYNHPHFYVGFSVPNMLASSKTQVNNEVVTSVSNRILLYTDAGYYWYLNPYITIMPHIQVRVAQAEKPTARISLSTIYLTHTQLGVTYSTAKAFSGYLLFNIYKYYLSVGYGYETYFARSLYLPSKSSREFSIRVKW